MAEAQKALALDEVCRRMSAAMESARAGTVEGFLLAVPIAPVPLLVASRTYFGDRGTPQFETIFHVTEDPWLLLWYFPAFDGWREGLAPAIGVSVERGKESAIRGPPQRWVAMLRPDKVKIEYIPDLLRAETLPDNRGYRHRVELYRNSFR